MANVSSLCFFFYSLDQLLVNAVTSVVQWKQWAVCHENHHHFQILYIYNENVFAGVSYTLSYENDLALKHGCIDSCVYTEDGGVGADFCFKTGNLTTQCHQCRQLPGQCLHIFILIHIYKPSRKNLNTGNWRGLTDINKIGIVAWKPLICFVTL